jgi:membrane peptidoglycan carboxypeptidase
VVNQGTGFRAAINRPQAGKTGTSSSYHDAWFVGYTPDFAAAVWLGVARGQVSMTKRNGFPDTITGGTLPAQAWARFASAALAGVPPTDFAHPAGALVDVTVDVSRRCLPNDWTPQELRQPRTYVKGSEPTEVCTEPHRPDLLPAPAFIGLARGSTAEVAAAAELKLVFVDVYGTGHAIGEVVDQSPSAGSPLAAGATVTLRVAGVPGGPAVVPNVTGLRPDVALARLVTAGLVGTVVVAPSCAGDTACAEVLRKNAGLVWHQDLTAGSATTEGSQLVLTVEPEAGAIDLVWPPVPSATPAAPSQSAPPPADPAASSPVVVPPPVSSAPAPPNGSTAAPASAPGG